MSDFTDADLDEMQDSYATATLPCSKRLSARMFSAITQLRRQLKALEPGNDHAAKLAQDLACCEAERDEAREDFAAAYEKVEHITAELRAHATDLAKARADVERMNWLVEHKATAEYGGFITRRGGYDSTAVRIDWMVDGDQLTQSNYYPNLRAAIDAARAKEDEWTPTAEERASTLFRIAKDGTTPRWVIAAEILAAEAAAREAERERCVKAMCAGCIDDENLFRNEDGRHLHTEHNGPAYYCPASPLHERAWQEAKVKEPGGEK